MELGPLVADFKPPHPEGISLDGKLVQLVPMEAEEHAEALFEANQLDTEGTNWAYLPYGPFSDLKSYHSWVRENQGLEDPVFLAIVEKTSGRPLGIASYLRIHPAEGSIEVGHIHFSPLLQRTTSATESMFLMMQWPLRQAMAVTNGNATPSTRLRGGPPSGLGFLLKESSGKL